MPNSLTRTPPRSRPRLRLLIADDDGDMRTRCAEALAQRGHRVSAVSDGDAAVAFLERAHAQVDLAIFDWQMPGLHGESLLQAVSWRWPEVPVVVITAFSSESRAIAAVGYAAGYLRKPFSGRELCHAVARLWEQRARRQRRRLGGPPPRIVRVGELALHRERLELRVGEAAPVRLSPAEFALLAFLIERPGQVVSRKALAAAIQPGRYTAMEASRVLKHPLAGLRRKLESHPRRPRYLLTCWRRGLVLQP